MKTIVLNVSELYNEKTKKKIMKSVHGISGVVSTSVDMERKKLTVRGNVNPATLANKLGKFCYVEIISVVTEGPPTNVVNRNDGNQSTSLPMLAKKVMDALMPVLFPRTRSVRHS